MIYAEAKQAGRKGKTLKGNLSYLHIMTAEPKEDLPPGFRFHPSDEELITFYLMNTINDATFTGRAIADVDLNKCEPWELPGKYILLFQSNPCFQFMYHMHKFDLFLYIQCFEVCAAVSSFLVLYVYVI